MAKFLKIKTIYVKELLETLRDHRTLIAMLVVPVLLYPLMMIGLVRIQAYEHARLEAESYTVAVQDIDAKALLEQVIDVAAEQTATRPRDEVPLLLPAGGIRVVVADIPDEAIGEDIHAKVIFEPQTATQPASGQDAPAAKRIVARILYRETKVRSDTAARILDDLFEAYKAHLVERSVDELQVSLRRVDLHVDLDQLLNPVAVTEEPVDTQKEMGGYLLSRIVPFILILMTVTGALYPAIDLTAGERERGTLETLLVAPVRSIELITGKFMAVATIAILTSLLNVASMAATVRFGGILEAMEKGSVGDVPLYVLPIIILSLIPFSVLGAAAMLAVCSFARSSKEAQNYATPLIFVTMIPAAIGIMETVRLEGPMLLVPIANVALLVRDLLQENMHWTAALAVVGSTTLYAAAAVALATRLFGQEAVVFLDAASVKSMVVRRFLKPRSTPAAAQALVLVALLFPLTYYVQTSLQLAHRADFAAFLRHWGIWQFVLLVGVPAGLCWYLKIDLRRTFRVSAPPLRFWLAAAMMGLSTWLLVIKVGRVQNRIWSIPTHFVQFQEVLHDALVSLGPVLGIFLLAVLPAISEELLFRGYLLTGVGTAVRKWGSILLVGALFGAFHFALYRFASATLMGILLAYLCWHARSVLPAILAHMMHNALLTSLAYKPDWPKSLGLLSFAGDPPDVDVPILIVAAALVLLGVAVGLCRAKARGGLTDAGS